MRKAILLATALFLSEIGATLPPGVVLWDIERRQHERPRVDRRAKTAEEIITNEKQRGGYYATVRVGTPFQDAVLQLDTGSSDTWVPSARAPICSDLFDLNPCPLGMFDEGGSSSFEIFLPGDFNISYLDGSYSKGDYFTDRIEIGGTEVKSLPMGLGLNTSVNHGLVGLGYTVNEVSIRMNGTEYDNLPVAMARDNLTNSVAYSLWLNDLDASQGNVLFGGVDTEKYVGDMMRVDILPDEKLGGAYTHFTINMTSMKAKSPSGEDTLTSEGYPIQVVLDSGTTLTFLPADLVTQVWEEAGVEFNDILKEGLIPCSRRNSPGLFVFGFGGPDGPKIEVPMDELVLDLTLGGAPPFPGNSQYKGQDACLFGVQPFTEAPYILGDTLLRSAYVVYDLVNNQIGLAQTDFNETGSKIVSFENNGSTIPMSTIAPNQGRLDTAAELKDPSYAARDGFQSAAWARSVFQVSAWLAMACAFLVLA